MLHAPKPEMPPKQVEVFVKPSRSWPIWAVCGAAVAAIAVALLIVRAAWKLTRESGRDLLDASLPPEEIAWIRERVSARTPTVRGFHHLRTRKAGAARFIELHVVVDKDLTVERAHRLADAITRDLKAHLSEATVTIHVEPCDGSCRPACLEGCLLAAQEREAIEATALGNAAQWETREQKLRETEWAMHERAIAAAKRGLDAFMEREKVYANLADIARILEVASKLGRMASGLATETVEHTGEIDVNFRLEVEAAVKKVYGDVVDVEPVKEVADARS